MFSHTQQYFNFSPENSFTGPWNEGEMPKMGKDWEFVADPVAYAKETVGLSELPDDRKAELKETDKLNAEMSEIKSAEVKDAEPKGVAQWSDYGEIS